MLKENKIYWLFEDGSIAHIYGKPFQFKPIAWKFESEHNWNYNLINSPSNYYKC